MCTREVKSSLTILSESIEPCRGPISIAGSGVSEPQPQSETSTTHAHAHAHVAQMHIYNLELSALEACSEAAPQKCAIASS